MPEQLVAGGRPLRPSTRFHEPVYFLRKKSGVFRWALGSWEPAGWARTKTRTPEIYGCDFKRNV